MYTEVFDIKDKSFIKLWLEQRQINGNLSADLPKYGLVVYERGEPIAAGFLRRCEGRYGIIDSVVTNPDAPSDMRYQALDIIVEELMDYAESLNILALIAFTVDENTKVRALRHGFVQLDHMVISKTLGV